MKHVPFKLLLIVLFAGIVRIFALDQFPPGLYSDEVSQGYNAYSMLKTARDEHGTFLPVSLRAFGEWKPALPTYLMVPTIFLFGLNAWGVRLPSATLGTLTVALTYYLVQELLFAFSKQKTAQFLSAKKYQSSALLSALFLAISPWHILQSRSAMHGSVTLFFMALFLWSFLKGIKSGRYLYLASISITMTMYSYFGMTAVGILILFCCAWYFRKELKKQTNNFVWPVVLGILLLVPLLYAAYRDPDVLLGRARYVSVFYDQGVSLSVWSLITQDGVEIPPLAAQFLHNKPYHYLVDIVRRLFEHFDGTFLFLRGDVHPPFQIPGMGIMYLFDGLALLAGLIILVKQQKPLLLFMLSWVVITIFPSALTFITPSANRPFLAVLPLLIIGAIGVIGVMDTLRKRLAAFIVVSTYAASFIYFCFQYFVVLPKNHADWWYGGAEELVSYLNSHGSESEQIVISGMAYIFLLFYREVDPTVAQSLIERNYTKDNLGFEHVDGFGKYRFPRNFKWEEDIKRLSTNSLVVVRADQAVDPTATIDRLILYTDGRVAYKILKV